jgi:hypothetical protein
MKPRRLTTSGVMLLVGAVAANCGVIRYAFVGEDRAVAAAAIGVLLTANVVGLGILRLATSRESRRPFLLGFTAHGLAAISAFLASTWLFGDGFAFSFIDIFNPILAVLGRGLPEWVKDSAWLGGALEITLVTVLLGLPMLAYAAFGGLLCTLVARIAVPARADGKAGSRTSPHLAAADDGPDRGTEQADDDAGEA